MTVWFLYLGIAGPMNIGGNLNVFRAFNPVRGLVFLFDGSINRAGLMVLGNVFPHDRRRGALLRHGPCG